MTPDKVCLFIIDSLRYDCIGFSPQKDRLETDNVKQFLETPTMDKLSKESIFFTRCYSTSSSTSPVVASIFTGTKPSYHGIRTNSASSKIMLNKNIITLAEILKSLGYLTVYAGDPPQLLKFHNMDRGFDYDFSFKDKDLFKFMQENADKKIFLFALFEDVHAPYLWSNVPPYAGYNDDIFEVMNPVFQKYNLPVPKNPFDTWKYLREVDKSRKLFFPLYVRGVSKFDKGRLRVFFEELEKSKFLEPKKSLVILTADHGEGKYLPGKHSEEFLHGGDAYDDSAKVPLIVRLPSLIHQINDDLVSNIDIFRIILDICSNNETEKLVNSNLYCINPLKEKRDSAWFVLAIELPPPDDNKYRLYVRTIITKNKKFSIRGKPEELVNPSFFKYLPNDFIKTLYNNLFIRAPSDEELNEYTKKIESNTVTRLDLYNQLLQKSHTVQKCFVFDLEMDPLEENPLNPFKDPILTNEYLDKLENMLDIDKPDTIFHKGSNDTVNKNSLTEEEIREELEKLGYL